jgi:hypothetical protein
LSHWQLEKKRTGRRDDVFRVFETIADLLGDGIYHEELRDMHVPPGAYEAVKIDELIRFKSTTDLFTWQYGGRNLCGYHHLSVLHEQGCKNILDNLKKALRLVRGIGHVDSRPDYKAIIDKLTFAISILDEPRTVIHG